MGVNMFAKRKTIDPNGAFFFLQQNVTTSRPKARRFEKKGPIRKRDSRRRLFLETLETRQLLAASIIGTVYEDMDRSGGRNNGENGVSGWTVFLDANSDGALNAGELSGTTNVDGDYSFNSVAPGNYRVALVMKQDWVPTSPLSKNVVAGTSGNVRSDFFVFSGGDIVGTIWNDFDHNGIRATDPGTGAFTDLGIPGWTVFLDLNRNNSFDTSEPTTITDANGSYSFLDLPPGDYEVFEVVPAGWDISPLHDSKQTARVVSRTQVHADYANFSTSNGAMQGTVFNDLNADGIRATDPMTGAFLDPGLEGWTVYLDLNNDRIQEIGEPSTTTNPDGLYSFLSLLAGDYEVTEVVPAGWTLSPLHDNRQTVTVTGGELITAPDFPNFTTLNGSISGTIWNDINRNGVRDINALTGALLDPPLSGWQVFVDLNRNRLHDTTEPVTTTDVNGNYSFLNLQVGDYDVQEVLPTGWQVSTTFSDHNTVTVFSGADSTAPDFANYDVSAAVPGSVGGVVWNDLNGNGLREVTDVGLAGWTVFLDRNNDGLLTVGEPQVLSGTDGSYLFSSVASGTVSIGVLPMVGWRATAPIVNSRTISLLASQNATGLDFGEAQLKDSTIRGVVFADTNKNGIRDAGERGLAGLIIYLDTNNNNTLDAGEPSMSTSEDLFYTPATDEAGTYSFTHLASGTYTVRHVMPAILSATPSAELLHTVTIVAAEDRSGVNVAAVFRANEILGVKFDDINGNHLRDAGELGMSGITIFIDLNRNNILDTGEPTAISGSDGSYSFTNLSPGKYVVRSVDPIGHEHTYPTSVGGILWPTGVSNAAVGNVSPTSITYSLTQGQSQHQSVSITLPNTGALTNLVDVFLLFDDTGSFTSNSPIVRAAFPTIMTQLQASLAGIDLGFGVGRFEEYGNFASEYATGRPFVLNQPIVAATSAGYQTSIQAALDRTTPGYGGDQPETDIEALFQVVTGRGFDGNNNGSVLDSGIAGAVSNQLTPGNSGDVPPFASKADPTAGNVGGAGFRTGALPIILLATDTGFAYQPKGETSITGVNGLSLPLSSMTQTSRPTTPFNSGAGIQETITGLNALGALVIGLGTNSQTNIDPRQQLESISQLTGAINRSTTSIPNGTGAPILPGDPLYFQIATGFGASVASGVVNAIQNAVTNVAVNIDVIASDPRVHIVNHTGIKSGIGAGQTATFDIEFIGDGTPHRFDLQFVRSGTNVILGSIPVVLGTPIPGDGYEFDDLDDGQIEIEDNFGSRLLTVPAASVSQAYVFYNDSGFETFGGVAAAIDNAGKQLLPSNGASQTTAVTNVSNYVKGINGLVFDINNLATSTLTANDFIFRMKSNTVFETVNPSTWLSAPTPTVVNVTPGATSRVRLEWTNNAIQNTWLQVVVKANTNTGLAVPAVFYIGHAAGEGTASAPYRVGVNELSNIQSGVNSAIRSIMDVRDVDKNRRVGVSDLSFVQAHVSSAILLDNIVIPIAGSAEEGANLPPVGFSSLVLASEVIPSIATNATPAVVVDPLVNKVPKVSLSLTPVGGSAFQVVLPTKSPSLSQVAVASGPAVSLTSSATSSLLATNLTTSIDAFFAGLGKGVI